MYGKCTLIIDGKPAGTIAMPDMNVFRAEAFIWQELRGYHPVFSGTSFPPIEFDKPGVVRKLIGSYRIDTTYYDDQLAEVTQAANPGRYGAVARITTGDGKTYRRFTTLYHLPKPVEWWNLDFKTEFTLPTELGISTQAISANQESLKQFASSRIRSGFTEDPSGAVLLAGLQEAGHDDLPHTFYNNPQQRDRRWWLKLKRTIYGWDKEYPGPFICPKPISGVPGKVVRPGSLEQAGMKPDFREKLDALLQKWAADTDQAFAVCVVRHGIIAFHKAYGMRDGKPMTVDTPSWMASTSKMISGTCIMMLVDQGMITLDDPVQKYLPALRINPSKTPVTFRNLYTHTDGFEGHWGSWMHDMEERIAMKVPYYQVGTLYKYNGTGMDLGCKALEAVSGETLPDFYQQHLLKPLGCAHTFIGNACSDGRSTPLDMAKIGQMLLQKGAYGEKRFFSEKTFKQMLPRNLEYILGKKTPIEYGIGTTFYNNEGWGKDTFAHGAASSAATRIDPENDLVISMTRNTAGKNYGKYHPQFIKTIIQGMQKDTPGQ
jgi:CubicO group peptidase (beta-lactamase class C family)